MSFRIKRRRLGQLAIASAATTAVTNFADKVFAQKPQQIIYGVRLASPNNLARAVTDAIDNKTPELLLISANTVTGKVLKTIEIASQVVDNPQVSIPAVPQALFTSPSERITGLTTQSDGILVVSTVVSNKKGSFSRLLFTDQRNSKPKAKKVAGLRRSRNTIESLLAIPTRPGKLLSVLSLNQGIPPFDLGEIDVRSGKVQFGAELALPELPLNRRFSNLAQSPDGTIYATTLGSEGSTTLVQLDLTNKAIVTGRGKIIRLSLLRIDNEPLENDLLSLSVSPSGQVFALANPKNEQTNSLFSVDVRTGEMRLLRQFEADKITFAR